MRVLLVEPFSRGGTAQYTYQLARALSRTRCDVILLAPSDYELAHRFSRSHPSLSFAPLLSGGSAFARRASNRLVRRALMSVTLVRNASRLLSVAHALRPDVIHLQGGQIAADLCFTLAASAACRLTGSKLAYSIHSTPADRPLPHQWALHRITYSLPHVVIAYTGEVRGQLAASFGINPGRVKIIPTPVFDPGELFDMDRCPTRDQARGQLGFSPDDRVVLLFGQIRHNKGLGSLVEAFAKVRDTVPSARLLIVGQPHSGLGHALALADRLDVRSRLTMVPRYVSQEEVPGYFACADVVALPYVRITQSAVLALALGFNKPVVATSVGGLPEMVNGCSFARVVQPNSRDDLAAAIRHFLSAPPRTDGPWTGATSWLSVARRTAAAYSEVLSSPPFTNW